MTVATRDFTVINYGVDTSSRPILMTRYLHAVLVDVLADPRVQPFADKIVIVQGGWMERIPGGGADASAGYHDKAKCLDFRTWNLTTAELDIFIRVWREKAGAIWRRNAEHGGMADHAHLTDGPDEPGTAGADDSWDQYVAGLDGLASRGPDYEWRPTPLVTDYTPTQGDDDMQEADFDRIAKMLDFRDDRINRRLDRVLAKLGDAKARDNALKQDLSEVADQLTELENDAADDATKQQVLKVRKALIERIKQAEADTLADTPKETTP